MQVFLRTGHFLQNVTFDFDPSVDTLKQMVFEKDGTPPDRQNISLVTEMVDGRPLSEYCIPKQGTGKRNYCMTTDLLQHMHETK